VGKSEGHTHTLGIPGMLSPAHHICLKTVGIGLTQDVNNPMLHAASPFLPLFSIFILHFEGTYQLYTVDVMRVCDFPQLLDSCCVCW
jgi:hypothetical protein